MPAPLRERVFRNWIWRLPTNSKSVALTFDDGPAPETTPILLDALSSLGIVSTHFVVGSRVEKYPNSLRLMASTGHAIGNHGWQHESLQLRSREYQKRSLMATDNIVREVAGRHCEFFRPPFGLFNPFTQSVLRSADCCGVLWSLIANDWEEQSQGELWSRIAKRLHEGAIIVLHDGHPTTKTMIRVLPRLADEVFRRGWSFVPLTRSLF